MKWKNRKSPSDIGKCNYYLDRINYNRHFSERLNLSKGRGSSLPLLPFHYITWK